MILICLQTRKLEGDTAYGAASWTNSLGRVITNDEAIQSARLL